MLPESKSSDLLYATDGVTDVDVMTYPGYKLVGELGGAAELAGVCTDKRGNVWIPTSARSTIVEYAHGGMTPIATLNLPNQYTVTCAVDPISGDLAVSAFPLDGGSLSIAIFAGARGNPISYPLPQMTELGFIAYGPRSQLYFDGLTTRNKFELERFLNGTFTQVRVRGATINSPPGGIQYAGGFLTIGVRQGNGTTSLVYQMREDGVIEHTTPLLDSYTCQGYLIWKKQLICPSGYNDLRIYPYPQGGSYAMKIPLRYNGSQVAMSVGPP